MFKSYNISNFIFSCASYVGRQDVSRGRKQEINIGSGCDHRSTTVHEVIDRSYRPEGFYKKSVLKIFPKFTGKDLCRSLFLIKLHSLQL